MKYASNKYTSGEKALTRKEYDKLLLVIGNYEDELFLKMAVTTGLRRQDLASVKIGDIDLKEQMLYFHESKKNINRPIPLSDEICLLITKYLHKTSGKPKDNLFSCTGTQMYRRFNGYDDNKKVHHIGYFDKAGIANRPIHAFRATAIKWMKEAGYTDPQIMSITGDTLAVIQQHYMTPSMDEMRAAVKEKPIL